jgi:hypothetical protein
MPSSGQNSRRARGAGEPKAGWIPTASDRWQASYGWQGVTTGETERQHLKLLTREPGLLEDDPQCMLELREQQCPAPLTPESFRR